MKSFLVALQNVNKLEGKQGDIEDVLSGSIKGVQQPLIYGIVEHWGNNNIVNTQNHVWFGIDRPDKDGMYGGVGAFVHRKISDLTRILTEHSDHNVVWLRTVTTNKPFFTAVVYSNPKDDNLLRSVLSRIEATYAVLIGLGPVLIMGDFNCRLGKLTRDKALDQGRANILKDFFVTTKTRPLVNQQQDHWTCYKNGGHSVADLFIVEKSESINCKYYTVHKDHHFGSDHALMTFRWNLDVNFQQQDPWKTYSLTQIDWDDEATVKAFTAKLYPLLVQWKTQVGYPNLSAVTQPTSITNSLVTCLEEALKAVRKLRKSPTTLKFMKTNSTLLTELRGNRQVETQNFHSSLDPAHRSVIGNKLLHLQNLIEAETLRIGDAKVRLVWDKILEEKDAGKTNTYWKMVSNIRKKKEADIIKFVLDPEGKHISKPQGIVNELAKNYQSVAEGTDEDAVNFRKLNDGIFSSRSYSDTKSKVRKIYFGEALKSMSSVDDATLPSNSLLTLEELVASIKTAGRNKSTGLKAIPNEALSRGGRPLLECLLFVFNAWWTKGITPTCMQTSAITPVYKEKGDRSDPKSYRPISLLESLFKTYEKILESRLRALASENGLIPPQQMGAMKGFGTTEAIFQLLSATTFNRNRGSPVFMTLLDLSKAYDRVWRTGLWARLWSIGVKGSLLRALHSTYSSPTSVVKVGDYTSPPFTSADGLRQGSVLSPLLFILLISDVANALDRRKGVPTLSGDLFHCQLFVDDTILLTQKESDIPVQINSFNKFAAVWGSVLNISKTVILSTTKIANEDDWLDDYLMEKSPANIARYLGVWISLKNYSWNQHFDIVISKARKAYFYLKTIGLRKECLSAIESIFLFKVLILPKLFFAAEVILPSEAVMSKVDNFIGYCVQDLLGIPFNASAKTALWEANLPSFKHQLYSARLRFHWKISREPKYQDVYAQGNYLYDANSKILLEMNLTTSSLQATGKFTWKSTVRKAIDHHRQAVFKLQCPGFAVLKPNLVINSELLNLKAMLRMHLMNARHSLGTPYQCTCKPSICLNQSLHLLTECTRADVLPRRTALAIQLLMRQPNLDLTDSATTYLTLIGSKQAEPSGAKPMFGFLSDVAVFLSAFGTCAQSHPTSFS